MEIKEVRDPDKEIAELKQRIKTGPLLEVIKGLERAQLGDRDLYYGTLEAIDGLRKLMAFGSKE